MYLDKWFLWSWLVLLVTMEHRQVSGADDYNLLNRDGSYEFGYNNPDSFHHSQANRANIVRGEFGSRNPGTGAIDTTQYTAGPRGFRPRGKNVVRKYDFSQTGPRPVGSRDDPYFDPNEDPSYSFGFNTGVYNRKEAANRVGDVAGKYSYYDDVGERHNVEYIAGKNTGFHVKTPFPDSNPRAYGPLYYNGRGKPIPRGRTSIERGLDGSYRFISTGPDQRRTEVSDSTGHVRGSYTYRDNEGVQHSVHYIAGPETGYRVLKNVKGPHLPTLYPFGRPEIIPSDFYDYLRPGAEDVFATAESGHIKPPKGGNKPSRPSNNGDQFNFDNGSDISGVGGDSGGGAFDDNFGKPGRPGGSAGGGGSSSSGGGAGTGNTGSGGGSTGFGQGGTGSGPSASGGFGTGPSAADTGASGPGGSGTRPSGGSGGTSRPPFGSGPKKPFGTRPPRPFDDDDSSPIDFDDLFGSTSSSPFRPRPSGSTYRPPSSSYGPPSGSGSTDGAVTDDGSYKPTGDDGTYNHGTSGGGSSVRPGGDFVRPTRPSGGLGGGFTNPGISESSKPGRPGQDNSGPNDVNDFNLFDGSNPTRAPGGPSRPPGGNTHIGISHTGSGDVGGNGAGGSGGYNEHGTIVTNVGDRLFSVPPGVSVRAHVQAIDLLPLGPRSPSPSDQLKAETHQELTAETSNIEELSTDASETNSTITLPPSNVTESFLL